MAAGEEIDLTGLAQVIERVTKEIKNLSTHTKVAEQYIMGLGDKKAETQLKTIQTAISGMDASVKGMIDSMKGGKSGINTFLDNLTKFRESLKSTEGLTPPVTGLMESLNKLTSGYKAFNSVLSEGMKKSTTEASSLLKLVEKFPITFDLIVKDYQRTNKLAEERALREKEITEWAEKHAVGQGKVEQNIRKQIGSVRSLGNILKQIQEKKVLQGDTSAIKSYLKQEMSIKRMNNALNGLRSAQERCNLATEQGRKKYQQIDAEIKQIEKTLLRVNGGQNALNSINSKMKNGLGQIAMSFGLMTGIFGATNFFRSLYRITAEFQLQQKALGAIVQNAYEANILFKRMQSLAVESPMKLLDLNKYAKQLAAFRIETQELYDTMKMLGDISVGVGVDMDRLILAYGQVKAANYLRGQELRQFSEAGVNILGGLQEYYRETKNINMSINEIFDSVSKRKVLFDDVDAVLKRMTESGGIFYNMQLIQSQTLYGQLQKLGDIFQIQMNDIGKSTSGILLLMIKLVQTLVSNLKLVVPVVGTFATYAGVRKLVLDLQNGKLVSKDFKLMLEACRVQASLLSKAGWKELIANIRGATAASASLKANLVGLGVGLAVLAGSAIFGAIQKRNQKLDEAADRLTEIRKRAYAIQELEKQFRSRPAYKERLALLQQLDEKAKEFGYHLRIAEDVTPQNISRVWAEALKNFNDYNDRVANYESAIANRPAIERNTKDLARITGVQALAYEEARRDYEFFTMNADRLSRLAKQELEKITKIKEDFIKNEREATLEYGYTSKQFETVFAESMLRIRRLVQGSGVTSLIKEFEKERGGFNTYLKKFFEGGLFGQNDYESELKDVKRKLKKAAEDVGIVGTFVGSEEDIRKKIEETYPAWKSALKGIPDIIKPELPNIFAEITGAIPKIVLDVDYQLDHSESDLQDKEWVKDYRKFMKESGFEYDKSQDAYVVDAKVDVVYGNYDDPLQVKDLDKDVTVIKRALTDLNVSGQENMDDFKKRLTDRKKRLEEFIEKYTNQVALIKFINKEFGEGIDFSDYEAGIASLKAELEIVEDVIKKVFGGLKSSSSGRAKSMKSEYQSMIDFVRELNREFDKLRENFNEKDSVKWAGATNRILSSFEAKFGAMPTKFKKAFQDTLSSIDFTTKEGTVEAENIVKGLIDSAKDLTPKEKEELQRAWGEAVGQIKLEAELKLKKESDEKLKREVQKEFDDYNLTLELGKLGVDESEVGKLFNITTRSLSELQKQVERRKKEFIGEDMEKEYRQFMRKIVDINDKANLEMAKKYVKYLAFQYDERAKLEIEYMRKRAEVYALPFDEQETMRILENLQKETQKKLDDIKWNEFRGSDYYIELFEDLDNVSTQAITDMIYNLNELKSSLSNLSPTELKTMTEQIVKLEDTLIKRNPFRELAKSFKELKETKNDTGLRNIMTELLGDEADFKKIEQSLDKSLSAINKKILEKNREISNYAQGKEAASVRKASMDALMKRGKQLMWYDVSSLREEAQKYQAELKFWNDKIAKEGKGIQEPTDAEKQAVAVNENLTLINALISSLETLHNVGQEQTELGDAIYASAERMGEGWQKAQEELEEYESQQDKLQGAKKILTTQKKSIIALAEGWQDTTGKVRAAFDTFMDNLDYLGGSTSELTNAWKEFGDTIFDTVTGALEMIPSLVTGFTAAGVAINSAMGIIGLIATAIQLVLTLLSSISKIHDARIAEEMGKVQKSMDRLKKTADELSEAFDNVYNEDRLREFNAATIKTRELYIKHLEEMIRLEEKKKKTDKDSVEQWKEDRETAIKDIREDTEKLYESLGGFGSEANMKSQAEQWTDAWYEAFKETGDGLKGLEESFDEFLDNLFKRQIMNRLADKYFTNLFSDLDEILATQGGVLGNRDAFTEWMNALQTAFGGFNEEATEIANAFMQMGGFGGGLEGLTASLQGMTEETAEILAAYLNSVRYYVADNNQLLRNLYEGLAFDSGNNPIVEQLKIVAANTNAISTMFSDIYKGAGHDDGGAYIKVRMG